MPQDRRAWNRAVGTRYESIPKRSERRRFEWGRAQPVPLHDDLFSGLLQQVAQDKHARVMVIGHQGVEHSPLYRLDLRAPRASGASRALRSKNSTLKRPLRVLISAKIHGDEHVGKEVVRLLVQRFMADKKLRAAFDLTLLPELNVLDRRLAPGLVNLNRTFPPERTRATNDDVIRSLEGQGFDLFVGLHGAMTDGFFIIRNQDDQGMSRRILSAMNSAVLLDTNPDELKVRAYKLHCLGGAQSQNPGTLKGYMARLGVPYSYTLEAPRVLSPEQQVRGAYKLLRSAMHNVARHGTFTDGR